MNQDPLARSGLACDRRDFLGRLAALPLWARGLAALPAERAPRSLILVWLDGGLSHLDSFDAKPEASVAIRGDLRAMRSAVDGVWVSEHLPELARRMDRCALLRSLSHGEGNHDRGSHLLLTGHRPSPVLVHPALGAVHGQDADAVLPHYVAIPSAAEYAGAGFLPATRAPFAVGGDPGRPEFAVRDLHADPRRARAHELLAELDRLDGAPRGEAERERDRFQERARRLAEDPHARRWFDLGAEPAATREVYGRHRLGQSCLLARRLVEGGVRTVLVHDTGWDHHQQIRSALTYGFPPKLTALDGALAALLDDLRRRELESRVVVCVASEFGRTPRLNPLGGRDHWPRAQSVLLFGAGIRPGVVGSTDARGEEPADQPLAPERLHATLAAALGLDLATILRTPDGRPVRLVAEGAAPIAEVLRA
ncbi:MAG: DUF1501 domain-containing protein [Planctomycetes bacterium]|nr:DUF1501 domain-containing protein [Planctomycetota bacterium]